MRDGRGLKDVLFNYIDESILTTLELIIDRYEGDDDLDGMMVTFPQLLSLKTLIARHRKRKQ
jgi:hypothetical protein